MRKFAVAIALLTTVAAASAQTRTLKQEPPEGTLRPGTRVLVDDGSCTTGNIKEVTAVHKKVTATGAPKTGASHVHRCISIKTGNNAAPSATPPPARR